MSCGTQKNQHNFNILTRYAYGSAELHYWFFDGLLQKNFYIYHWQAHKNCITVNFPYHQISMFHTDIMVLISAPSAWTNGWGFDRRFQLTTKKIQSKLKWNKRHRNKKKTQWFLKRKNSTVEERKFNHQEVFFPFFFPHKIKYIIGQIHIRDTKIKDEVFALATKEKTGTRKLATVTG